MDDLKNLRLYIESELEKKVLIRPTNKNLLILLDDHILKQTNTKIACSKCSRNAQYINKYRIYFCWIHALKN